MTSRTREKLIDVARQLFIRKGVDNTTIGDIASASDKGRRTIYTYFKNKKEIYNAVIERESESLVSALRDITESNLAPTEKLYQFLKMRLSETKLSLSPYDTIKSLIRLEFKRSDLIRKKAFEKEERMIFSILQQGIDSGDFNPEKCRLMRSFLYPLLHAVDVLSTHDEYPQVINKHSQAFIDFLTQGVQK